VNPSDLLLGQPLVWPSSALEKGTDMRRLALLLVCLAALSGIAHAQKVPPRSKAAPVAKVINANPDADGKTFRLDLLLKNGRHVAYEFQPAEASAIADGFAKPASAGARKLQVAELVYGMIIQADPEGRAVILTPRNRSGNLQSLAIPLTGADQLLDTLRAKIAEAKAFAVKRSVKPPKQTPTQGPPVKQ
jgi:hypothetical protein